MIGLSRPNCMTGADQVMGVGHEALVGLQLADVGAEEHQRGEAGRGDGVALGHGLHGVADGVELVGDLADLLRQLRHDGESAGVVGDRAEGVERDDDAREAEHAHDRHGHAVEAVVVVGDEDRGADEEHRQQRGVEAHGQPGDDVRGVAGLRSLGDLLHGPVLGRRVVIGDHHRDEGHGQPDERRDVDREPFGAEHDHGERPGKSRPDTIALRATPASSALAGFRPPTLMNTMPMTEPMTARPPSMKG